MRSSSIILAAFGAVAAAQLQARGVVPSSSSEELTLTTSTTRTNTVTATRTVTLSSSSSTAQSATESSSCSTVVTVVVSSSSAPAAASTVTASSTTSTVTVSSTTTATDTFTPSSPTWVFPSSSAAPNSSTEVSPELTSTSASIGTSYPPYGTGNATTYYGTAGTGSITSLISQTPTIVTFKPSSTQVSPVVSNKSSKTPASGLALMVTALMMVFMSLGDNLSLVSFIFLFLDCVYTRSMGTAAFVITYFAVGGSAFLLGETTLEQFLDMSV